MTSAGTTAFLQQAHRNNWQRYLASLQPGARRGWDVCVLTASDERQAAMYRRQLDWRRAAGLLPHGTQFIVQPDPQGQRIGSGGATFRALAHMTDCGLRIADYGSHNPAAGNQLSDSLPSSFEDSKFLIIHSGGDSKRLPHCSAVGKLFARVPRVLPDGRASTIFDEFLISLSGLAGIVPGGALVASGDVLLIFDHLQLSFRRGGVIGVAAAAPAEMGLRHGVYVSGDGGYRVQAYLHKPAAAELARWNAVAADDTVQIDTGLVWLDTATVRRLVDLMEEPAVASAPLNLYGDLLLPLAESTRQEDYLADTSDGPATPDVRTARQVIWERLRGVPFGVERLQPAVFVHFGSSREYWRMVAGDAQLAEMCSWQSDTASWSPMLPSEPAPSIVLINALVGPHPSPSPVATGEGRLSSPALVATGEGQLSSPALVATGEGRLSSPALVATGKGHLSSPAFVATGEGQLSSPALVATGEGQLSSPALVATGEGHLSSPAFVATGEGQLSSPALVATGEGRGGGQPLIVDSHLSGPLSFTGPAIIAGVHTDRPLDLAPDIVLDQWPLADGRYVTRLFGIADDPKRVWADPAATFVNRPWPTWLAEAGLAAETVWPDVPAAQCSLWNARLFPALADREASLALTLPLQDPAAAEPGWRDRWIQAPRLSLAASFAAADGQRLLEEVAGLEDAIAAHRFVSACAAESPAADSAALLGAYPAAQRRRAALAAAHIAAAEPVFRLRAYKALTVVTGDSAWEDRAFGTLAQMIQGTGGWGRGTGIGGQGTHGGSRKDSGAICVRAAARIDFGGGWTDTPPYSIERGGTVLNAAITLRGEHPIIAEVEPLAAPRLILESRDIDAVSELTTAGEALAYANPADPFALHKAALVLRGIVPQGSDPAAPIADVLRPLGCGLRLSTATTIPRGSGLGTSSILAGAVLASLQALLATGRGDPAPTMFEPAALFDEVLCLEQMLTTGGGWQDQVGGLTGGIKLVISEPGLPQRTRVEPLDLAPAPAAALAERLVMVYTGQQRLAKDLLRAVMGRWMARDPEMVWIQAEIARLALAMRDALLAGDLDGFGALLGEHWTLNKRMDPGCTNPFIDELFHVMGPHINGGKLAGAGGGGFVMAVARDRDAVADLAETLAKHYPGTPVAIWPCGVPAVGLITEGAYS